MRFNPVLREANKNPFLLDSPRPRVPLRDYHKNELRFRMLANTHPDEAERMLQLGQDQVLRRFAEYEQLASSDANMFAQGAR
jgi:pyruvate-ferredoxin/flavodoxin oxidoreductase